jgi:capsular polysaccharide biosynthesis protein
LIYLTRQDTNARRILNEDDLIYSLQKEGYLAVTCSNHTIEEQISIANSAGIIVSAHGAGMTNIGFSSRFSKVMEINPDRWGVSCFYSLTRMRHQRHYVFVEKNIEGLDKGHQMTMRVDIDSLLLSLDNFS